AVDLRRFQSRKHLMAAGLDDRRCDGRHGMRSLKTRKLYIAGRQGAHRMTGDETKPPDGWDCRVSARADRQAIALAAWPTRAWRSCTAMIACRMSQIGTSTVGMNDHGGYCIASEPGPAKSCTGDPSADVAPKTIASTRSAVPNRFQAAIAAVWRAPPSFRRSK